MKYLLYTAVFIFALFFFGRGQCAKYRGGDQHVVIKTSTTTGPKVLTKAEREIPTAPNGWSLEIMAGRRGYDWFTPVDNTKTTSWFETKGVDTTFNAHVDSVWELKLRDGSVAGILNRTKTTELFFRQPNGEFSPTAMSKAEFAAIAAKTEAIRFQPYENRPMDIKVGRKP